MSSPTSVSCPTCNKNVVWNDESRFKPFCCERCKLIDLGEWADGKHVIAGKDAPILNESENDPGNNY